MQMSRDEERAMIHRRRYAITSVGFALLLCCASAASAQVVGTLTAPAITTNFRFNVPFALTVAHPCQPAAFVLIKGTTALALTTSRGADFKLESSATATGTGEDATSTGLRLATGIAPYDYASDSAVRATFPDGTPAMFAHSLTVIGELIRSDLDAFTIVTVFDIEYTNGVPTTPRLKKIDVSCN
jgi:hypothetical protein